MGDFLVSVVKQDIAIFLLATIISLVIVFVDVGTSPAFLNQTVIVYEGDTIWSIGERFTKKGEDVRVVVERIYKANNLHEQSFIKPGQKLLIPVREESQLTVVELYNTFNK